MGSDIRSFFGGKPAAPPAAAEAEPKATKKRGRASKIVDDDDDDEEEPPAKKAAPTKKAVKAEPILEDTTADDFFGKGTKPKRSEAVSSKGKVKTESHTPKATPKKSKTTNDTPVKRSSARSRKSTNYDELEVDNFSDDPFEDIAPAVSATPKSKPKTPKKEQAVLKEHTQDIDDDEVADIKADDPDADFVVPDDDEEVVKSKPAKKAASKKKAKDEDEEVVDAPAATKKRTAPVKKAAPAKKQKIEEKQDSAELKAIFDGIPTIEPPPPPPKDGEKPKFVYGAHANSAAPAGALSSSDLPTGEENCLAGLTFVFTGQLATLGREQGQSLVKEYGGKVQAAPSKKTSYVVLGEDAGPKKLQTIKDYSLKVIKEEGLFELIKRLPANGGDSAAAEKQAEKRAKEEDAIRQQAAEMERQERASLAAAAKSKPAASSSKQTSSTAPPAPTKDPNNQLWTVRYAPSQLSQICGNKSQVEKLQRWLRAFPKNQRTHFKMGGADGSGAFRAVMIHGPPGIGKTTAAHLVAKLEGYDVVEQNASDTRSKKLVENGLKGVLSTTSLMGYFGQGDGSTEASKKKLVLIMDEVDGMSAGDRGGVGALAAVCKKSQIPMILICNDRKLPKMKPFDFVTFDLPFRRPTTDMIRSRIMTIAFREGLKMPVNVINALIEGSGADIRQVVNMISTAKLDAHNMDFDDSKSMSKAWEKHIVLKPWDMVSKILGGGMFNPASKNSLNDKQELYFNDHEFAPLMLQENYLGTKPQRANKYANDPKKSKLATLQLVAQAAESISDGDLIDRMIHGSQQQWSLMPAHAMASFVRPASYVHGSMAGHRTDFTKWLGNNSKTGKLMRFVKEIQGHMRLRTNVDRYELRQTYLPALYARLVVRLAKEGKDVVPDLIEMMDWYYLTRDDWDAILELGVGEADMAKVTIESQNKATFTRLYNQQSHPLPFIKASQIVAPKKSAKIKPDLEEAIDESDEGEMPVDDVEVKEEDDVGELDLSKDKYVKQPKKKKAPAKKAKKGADDDDDVDEKPKKGKGKTKAKK